MNSKPQYLSDLIAIGYWKSYSEPDLPDPCNFIDVNINSEERTNLAAYLSKNEAIVIWRGWSSCRFTCGIPNHKMGHSCISDGKYVWPEGLMHYVLEHNIWLPKVFIDHTKKQILVKEDYVPLKVGISQYNFDWWKTIKGCQ